MITMTTDNHDSLSPAQIAERADLCYVSDSEPGYRRKRWGRGFTYLDKKGNHITDKFCCHRNEAVFVEDGKYIRGKSIIYRELYGFFLCRGPD
jgi:hypothetical protein